MERLLTDPYFALASLVLGIGGTWFFAWWYFKRAGDELRVEATKLRNSTDLVLYRLLYPNAVLTPKYDSEGHVTGFAVDMAANLSGSGDLKASAAPADRA